MDPAEIAALDGGVTEKRNRVILRNIPEGLTAQGIRNALKPYGHVVNMHQAGNNLAFATFETAADAETFLRRFNSKNFSLPIIVDYARERENKMPVFPEQFDFVDTPSLLDNDTPMRNVLELSNRAIKGPFQAPCDIHKCPPCIEKKDYHNILLRCTDSSKEFCWDPNDETYMDMDLNDKWKIVHGRAIFKSQLKPVDQENAMKKESLRAFNAHLLPDIQLCAKCENTADKMCSSCARPICSIECHEQANSQKEQDLVDATATGNLEYIKAQPIEQKVKITSVINNRLVFIRPADDFDNIEFARLEADTVEAAKNAPTFEMKPCVGSYVLARLGYYQRALVLKHVSETDVLLAFIDYGNVETFDYRDLKMMPDQLKKVKRFATKVALNDIDNRLMNVKTLKYLYDVLARDTELKVKFVKNNETGETTAALQASNRWVNQMINRLNTEKVEKPTSLPMLERVNRDHLPMKNVDCADMKDKEVIILDDSMIHIPEVSIILSEELNQFRLNDHIVQNVCNYMFPDDELYAPFLDECCVAKFNGRWYRAECVEIKNDGFATLTFIDYGNNQIIEINDIRPMPTCLLFEKITMEVNLAPPDPSANMQQELKKQFSVKSRQVIDRMEFRADKGHFVWFQK